MRVDYFRATYRRAMATYGETVVIRRKNPAPQHPTECTVLARVTGYAPEELVGGITQGERKILILAEDLLASGFPVPPRAGDSVVLRGGERVLRVMEVDNSTRRVGGVLLAYQMRAKGS